MTEIINPPVVNQATKSQKIEYIVYFLFGVLEILLAFRLILKLSGASLASGFVGLIYGLTGIFVMPFNGIFSKSYESATIVALVVYLILAWGVVKLVRISSGEKQEPST